MRGLVARFRRGAPTTDASAAKESPKASPLDVKGGACQVKAVAARAWPGLLITLAAAAHLAILHFEIPFFTRLPHWFWGFQRKELGPWPLIAGLIAVAVVALAAALRGSRRPWVALAVIAACGYLMQHGFALLEQRGLDGLRDRMQTTGHALFARVAVLERDTMEVLRNYEALVAAGRLGPLATTKPPGSLLPYLATERLANALSDPGARWERLRRAQTLAAFLWPLAAVLALLPLFLLARRLRGDDVALSACLLYTLVPSAQLITLHNDQAFLPLCCMVTLFLATEALLRRDRRLAAAAGVAAYLGCFMSFGMVALLGVLAVASAAAVLASPAPRRELVTALAMVVGFAACDGLARLALGYDFVGSFLRSMSAHAQWKAGPWDLPDRLYCGFLDVVELAAWLGMPLCLLAALGAGRAALELRRAPLSAGAWYSLGLASVVATLALFGKTRAETARLWLFLVPAACLVASGELARRAETPRGRTLLLALVAGLQWMTIFLTKGHQDFW